MEPNHLFYHDWDPEYHVNQLKGIYRRWTSKDRERIECTDRSAHFLRVQDGRESPDALVLSKPLAEKIRKALCIAHQYWRTPESVADEDKGRFEAGARTEAWEEELEHLIEVMKKKVRKTGQATDQERNKLQDLLEERKKCHRTKKYYQYYRRLAEDSVKLGKERWINAWFAVQQELDRLWVRDGQIDRYEPDRASSRDDSVPRHREPRARSRSRDRRHRRSHREQRREARSRSTNHAKRPRTESRSRSHSRSRRQDNRSRHRRREPHTHDHGRQERLSGRSRGQSRYRSQSRSWSQRHARRQHHGQHHDRAQSENSHDGLASPRSPASSHSHVQSDPELWRVAGSNCDTCDITPARLEITAKPSLDWNRPDDYRDKDSQISVRDVVPAAIMADDVEHPFSDISIDDSVEAWTGQATNPSVPMSQQAQDFRDGLRQLALEYNKRETPSPKPTEPCEGLPHRPSGNKRKRENHDVSERKARKVGESSTNESESSACEVQSLGWAQEEPCVQAVAGRTPESMRMSIRDFFKPYQGRGESCVEFS